MAEPLPHALHPLRALLIAQCLGVLNHHVYKMVVSLLAIREALQAGGGSGTLALVNTVFILPFLLFAGYAGHAADVLSKRTVLVVAKISEVCIMGLGCAALLSGRLDYLLLVLALLATQATFFGPAKYGLLPEILPTRALGRANGLIEMGTFVAIVLGAALGAGLFVLWQTHLAVIGVGLLMLAVAGTIASLGIPQVPPAGARKTLRLNPWGDIGHGLQRLWHDRVLWLAALGITFFWFFAALLHMAVLLFGKEVMGLDDLRVGLLGTFLALGMGAGSMVAGRLSGHRAELGLVPLGALGMGVGTVCLALAASAYVLAALALVLLGLAGGWFIVPLQTFLQYKTRAEERGLLLATTSFLSMAAVLGASGVVWVGRDLLQWQADRLILYAGLVTLCGTVYVLYLLPAFLVRLLCWMLTHTLYRIRVVGAEHIPTQGPALLVCNHVSYVDALLVGACVPRFVRFLMYRPIYEVRALRWLFRLMHAIPITGGPGAPAALAQASQALQAGHVVCIFAEGAISRTGNLLPFKRGFERIVEGLDMPVIPLHLDRLWGSIFSFQGGRFLWKWPRQWPYPVTASFAAPMPARTTAPQVRQRIMELGSVAMLYRPRTRETLPRRFIATAKQRWSAFCMADAAGMQLTYGQALVRSLLLARWLRTHAPQAQLVALLLPPSATAALLNLAVLLAGKVPVNLDLASAPEVLQALLAQHRIDTVLTTPQMASPLRLPTQARRIDVTEMMAYAPRWHQAWLRLMARLLPGRAGQRLWTMSEQQPDTLATVVFSHTSQERSPGVMLSHYNILASIEGLEQVFAVHPRDRMLGVLPFAQGLGYITTLWFPLLAGCGAVYHTDGTEAHMVGALVQRYQATLLVGTPALYTAYLAHCPAPMFASLRYAVSGADTLDPALAQAFQTKYGVPLVEGYGCAEMAAVVSLNIADVAYGSRHQTGSKPGSAGHPIPGVAVKVVDPATGETLAPDTVGMLLVHGPHRMLGYLGDPARTVRVLRQGWYVTGDLACVDEDGFIHLVGRVSGQAPTTGQ